MGNENGIRARHAPTGSPAPAEKGRRTCPRRIALLRAGDDSEVESVLGEYTGAEPRGKDVHDEIKRHAERHRGRCVAAEWLGPLGWTRFLWCRCE